jgi:hypothetical protein
MAKLTAAQLESYENEQMLRDMARDIAKRKFGEKSAQTIRAASVHTVIKFIVDNQDD